MIIDGMLNQLLDDILSGYDNAFVKFQLCVYFRAFSKKQIKTIIVSSEALLSTQPYAMVIRAYMYWRSFAGSMDCAKAIELFDQAIALGNAAAMYSRACMYGGGDGGPVDYSKAIGLLDQAIALGNASAMHSRALVYMESYRWFVDYPKAIELLERAIDLGNIKAMNTRAGMYEAGRGGPVDYSKAIELYEHAIALKDPCAMNSRANMHMEGRGGVVDYPKASALYERASALGYPYVEYNRGLWFSSDDSKLIEAYERGIALGNIGAMCARADMHRESRKRPVDHPKAIALYTRAIARGDTFSLRKLESLASWPHRNSLAQFKLFLIYFTGVHTVPDKQTAISYFNMSKQTNLSLLCEEIQTRLSSDQKDSGDIQKLFYFLLDNMAEGMMDTKLKIRYLHLKVLLQTNQDEDAYRIYQTTLPSDYPLLGIEYVNLASFLLAQIQEAYQAETSERLRIKACVLFYKGHLLGDERAYDVLIQLLRERDSRQNSMKEKQRVSSMLFFNPDDTKSVESYEKENKRLIDVFVIEQQKEKEKITTAQKRKLGKLRSSLIEFVNKANFIYRFFDHFIVSFGSNEMKAMIDNIFAKLNKGEYLSDIIKGEYLDIIIKESGICLKIINSVLKETGDIDIFADIDLKNNNATKGHAFKKTL